VIPGTLKRLNIVATVLILTLTGEIIWIKNTDEGWLAIAKLKPLSLFISLF